MDEDDWLTQRFEAHRSRLSLAIRRLLAEIVCQRTRETGSWPGGRCTSTCPTPKLSSCPTRQRQLFTNSRLSQALDAGQRRMRAHVLGRRLLSGDQPVVLQAEGGPMQPTLLGSGLLPVVVVVLVGRWSGAGGVKRLAGGKALDDPELAALPALHDQPLGQDVVERA